MAIFLPYYFASLVSQSFSISFNYFQAFFHTEMQPAASSSHDTYLALQINISTAVQLLFEGNTKMA